MKMFKIFLSLILYVGAILILISIDYRMALGLFLWQWSNNLADSLEEAPGK